MNFVANQSAVERWKYMKTELSAAFLNRFICSNTRAVCVRVCVCVNYQFVYYVTFVFSITSLSFNCPEVTLCGWQDIKIHLLLLLLLWVLKCKICIIVYCDVVNVQPRFNFSDEIKLFWILNFVANQSAVEIWKYTKTELLAAFLNR